VQSQGKLGGPGDRLAILLQIIPYLLKALNSAQGFGDTIILWKGRLSKESHSGDPVISGSYSNMPSFFFFQFLFYSYVHTMFGSFLPLFPCPLSYQLPHSLPNPPLPLATRQKLFCPYL
jgi:hypothetical protein